MMPYTGIHMYFVVWLWKRNFSAIVTCFVVELQEVASLVFDCRRRELFERTLDFLHSSTQWKNIWGFLGSKWCHIYTFFTHLQPQPKIIFFLFGGQNDVHIFYKACCRRKNILGGVKMLPYVHILGSKWCYTPNTSPSLVTKKFLIFTRGLLFGNSGMFLHWK